MRTFDIKKITAAFFCSVALNVFVYALPPDFGANPTISSIKSGSWSDPSTWDKNRVPGFGPQTGEGDIVRIVAGHTVAFDSPATAAPMIGVVSIHGTLRFDTTASRRLLVQTLVIETDGTLIIGDQGNPVPSHLKMDVVFADKAFNHSFDPEEYGNGLLCFGKIRVHGAVKSHTFVRLAQEPRVGDTFLQLAESVTGINPGERLLLPDTKIRTKREDHDAPAFSLAAEDAIVTSVSGTTVFLSSPLMFDHPGARDEKRELAFLPHVAFLSRNVNFASENPSGVRGHLFFNGDKADVDIRYAAINFCGRTRIDALNTTTNIADRYPMFIYKLQRQPLYLEGNAIVGNSADAVPVNSHPDKAYAYGFFIRDSYGGTLKKNVVAWVTGTAYMLYNARKSDLIVDENMAMCVFGNGYAALVLSMKNMFLGMTGYGYYALDGSNTLTNNIAATIGAAGEGRNGRDAGYGLEFFSGNPNLPDWTPVAAMTRERFNHNEVYGLSASGVFMNAIGALYTENGIQDMNIISGMKIWRVVDWGYRIATLERTSIEDNTILGDYFDGYNGYDTGVNCEIARWFGPFTIKNSKIVGFGAGILPPSNLLVVGTVDFVNLTMANPVDFYIRPFKSYPPTPPNVSRVIVMRDIIHAPLPQSSIQRFKIQLEGLSTANVAFCIPPKGISDTAFVHNIDGSGASYEIFYPGQHRLSVPPYLPTSKFNVHPEIGTALTNEQMMNKYGVSANGRISRCTGDDPNACPNALVRPSGELVNAFALELTGVPPQITSGATANPNPSKGKTAALSVRASDDGGESNLTYAWSVVGTPPAPVTFSPNDINASKDTTATFSKAGTYTLQVRVMDAAGFNAQSQVVVVVEQTLSFLRVNPPVGSVTINRTLAFSPALLDQFEDNMTGQGSFEWKVSGGGNIDGDGVFHAGTVAGGPFTVTARENASGVSGTAQVNVITTLPPEIRISKPAQNETFSTSDHILILAVAKTSNSGGSISKVEFYDGTTLLGTVTAEPYQIIQSGLSVGEHVLTARATDNVGALTTSDTVTIRVTAGGGGDGGGGGGGNNPPPGASTGSRRNQPRARPSLNIPAELFCSENESAKVEIFERNDGRRMRTVSGSGSVKINGAGLPQGVYLYKLNCDGKEQRGKLVVTP